eukprot:jgi/Botrbrau1/17441/Bobra.0054s0030.2
MKEPTPAAEGGWQEDLTPAKLRHKAYYQHVLRGLDVLYSLCTLGETFPGIAKAMSSDDFQGTVVDLVTLIMVQAAGSESDTMLSAVRDPCRKEEALERAALVASALKILLLALCPAAAKGKLQLHTVCAGLLVKPRAELFVGAAFDAVRTLYRMVRLAMVEPECAVNIEDLTYHAGAAMDILQYLCAVPLFYYRMAMTEDSFLPALRLIHAGFILHDPPFAPPPSVGKIGGSESRFSTVKARGGLELLAARAMAMMVSLSMFSKTPFMDHIATDAVCQPLAREIIDRAFHMTGTVLSRPLCALVPVASSGEGQMAINALQLIELLADDSNYRRDAMLKLAPNIADVLLLPMANFKSTWCAGEQAATLHANDLFLDTESIFICQYGESALAAIDFLKDFVKQKGVNYKIKLPAAKAHHAALCALLRSTTFFKMLGNLHLYNEDISPEADKDLFAKELIRHLRKLPGLQNVQQAVERLRALDETMINSRGFAIKTFSKQMADFLCTEQDLYLVKGLIQSLQKKL